MGQQGLPSMPQLLGTILQDKSPACQGTAEHDTQAQAVMKLGWHQGQHCKVSRLFAHVDHTMWRQYMSAHVPAWKNTMAEERASLVCSGGTFPVLLIPNDPFF